MNAPIDIIPIFVRAGSILPLGAPVESTNEVQLIETLRVYAGPDADFDLYRDDGNSYAYENGASQTTRLHWSRAAGRLQQSGAALPAGSKGSIQIIGATSP